MASKFRLCSRTLNNALQTASIVLLENEVKSLRRELSVVRAANAELLLELVDALHELQHAIAMYETEHRVRDFFDILRR